MSLKNLEALFERAEDGDIAEGLLAYERYHSVLRHFAEWYYFGIVPTVEAFAALSPNNDYHGNLRSLASVLDGINKQRKAEDIKVSTYNACRDRAIQYVTGEVSFLDTVKGLKIRAFRHNLLYPAASREVTVDGHMIAAWLGRDALTMKQAQKKFTTAKYREIAKDITALARRKSILPHQMQAVLWITRKRVLSIKYNAQYHLEHGPTDLSRILCHPRNYPPF